MRGDFFKFLGAYLRQRVRHLAVTIILLALGGLLIVLALGMGVWALYLWLLSELGTVAALGIVGGMLALAGTILLAVAFRRTNRTPGGDVVPVEDAMRPVRVRNRRRRTGRESTMVTILITLMLGWIVGRRTRR